MIITDAKLESASITECGYGIGFKITGILVNKKTGKPVTVKQMERLLKGAKKSKP